MSALQGLLSPPTGVISAHRITASSPDTDLPTVAGLRVSEGHAHKSGLLSYCLLGLGKFLLEDFCGKNCSDCLNA